MTFSLTTADAMMRDLYENDMDSTVYNTRPLLALLPKSTDFVGRRRAVVAHYGDPASRSATFSVAQTNAANTSPLLEDFLITRVENHGVVNITNEAIEASKSERGSEKPAFKMAVDGIINELSNDLAASLFGSGFGARGQIDSTVTGTTLTLGNRLDIAKFAKGMNIVFSDSESGHTLRDSGEALTVVSVDRSAGSMVVSANLNTISGIAADDYIFAEGDRQNSATPARWKIAGLDAWLPTSAPSASESFFGVDRSVDSQRLGGLRYSASGVPLKEAVIEACVRVSQEGGKVDTIVMNYINWSNLAKSLDGSVRYQDLQPKAKGVISFSSLVVNGPDGDVNIIADRFCPSDRFYALTLSSWELASLGELVHIEDQDGKKAQRAATSSALEVRVASRANLLCHAPGHNLVCTL